MNLKAKAVVMYGTKALPWYASGEGMGLNSKGSVH
jgi:hypothetical protein